MSEKVYKCPLCEEVQEEGGCEFMTVRKNVDGKILLCCCDSLDNRRK